MATPTPGGPQTNLGLEPNIAAVICYVPCCVGLVFSVVAAIVEKQSRFVRFHAFQGILVQGAALVVLIGLQATGFVLGAIGLWAVWGLIWTVEMLFLLAAFGLLVFLMIKANAGEEFELPVIGPIVRQWV